MNSSSTSPAAPESGPETDLEAAAQGDRTLRRAFFIALGLALLLAGASQWVRAQLPPGAPIPMHWDMHGHVNRYGNSRSLFIMPSFIAGLSLLMYFLPRLDPRRVHLLRSAKAYSAIWLSVTFLFGVIHTCVLLQVTGHNVPVASGALAAGGLVIAVAGNYLGKVRSNHLLGVRTPWTLRSELAWNKSNRLGGRLLMLLGVLLFVAALTPLPVLYQLGAYFGGLLLVILIVTFYSYHIWRHDPGRETPRA